MIPQQLMTRQTPENMNKFLKKHGDRNVYIMSKQWGGYWRPGNCGYTENCLEAGVYTLREAYSASGHCGPEKGIHYQFVSTSDRIAALRNAKTVLLDRFGIFGGGEAVNMAHEKINAELESLGLSAE